jgi:hypothetical protein
MITLTGSTDAGQWQVSRDGQPVGTWHRTEHGAALDDTAGNLVVVVSNVAGAAVVVASSGARRAHYAGIAREVLAGACELVDE